MFGGGCKYVCIVHVYCISNIPTHMCAHTHTHTHTHTHQVEEQVLDYLAWSSDSPLYDAIEAAGSVPSYEDVALPPPTAGGVATPLHPIHPRVVSSLGGIRG